MPVAGRPERRVKIRRIRHSFIRLQPHRGQIAAAAEPPLRRHQHPRVEVGRRHLRALHMCHQADAAGPEPRVLGRTEICARKSGLNSPQTVDTLTPTFSNTRPFITLMTPPPPSWPSSVGRCQGVRTNRPGGRSLSGPA